MKNSIKRLRTIVLTLAMVFLFTACSQETNIEHTHEWGAWMLTKAPTCTTTGEETRVCSITAAHTENRPVSIDPLAHNWGNWIVTKAATETEE